MALEFRQRDIACAGQVAQSELVLGANIDQYHQALLHPLPQLLAGYRLERVALMEAGPHQAAHLGHVSLGNLVDGCNRLKHGIIGESIKHKLAVTTGDDETRAALGIRSTNTLENQCGAPSKTERPELEW